MSEEKIHVGWFVKRNYYTNSYGNRHASYTNVVHEVTDERLGAGSPRNSTRGDFSHRLLGDFEDGDVVEITVRKVGEVEGEWRLTEPHKYEKVYPDDDDSYYK